MGSHVALSPTVRPPAAGQIAGTEIAEGNEEMIFTSISAVIAMADVLAEAKLEREMVEKAQLTLPPDQFVEWFESFKRAREESAMRAKEERRHQELCSAIRSTSFWRFGG